MKKATLLASLILSLFSTVPAYANIDIDYFAGMGTGIQLDNVDGENELGSAMQLRAGAIINDQHRVMASYQYSNELEQHTYLASYDYIVPVTDDLNVFAGVSAGSSESEFADGSDRSFVAGGQIGSIYEFDDKWSLELVYRHLNQDSRTQTSELDYTQQFSASIDYKF